jgi:hypothetical protein
MVVFGAIVKKPQAAINSHKEQLCHFQEFSRDIPGLGISAENSVRPFRTTFLGLMESNPQLE